MDPIIGVILGWLAYLARGPVYAQIAVVCGPPIALLVMRRITMHPRQKSYAHALSILLIAGGITALALLRAPTGFALYLSAIYGLWLCIDGLRDWLEPRVDRALLSKADTEIVRPLILVSAGLILICKVSNISQLAVIPLFSWFDSILTVGQVVTIVVAFYALVVGSLPVSLALAFCLGRLLNLTAGSRRALSLIIRYSLVGIGMIWALDFTGFNRTAIFAIAGGLSVGLGFGVKEVFANFISGIWLLLEGSVRPGEVLLIDNDPCEVRRLGLRAALLWRSRDNTELLIPNQAFLTTTTTTFTCSDGMRRCEVRVSSAYRHEPLDVMALLLQAASEIPDVLFEPKPAALVLDYGDSAIQYAIRFWIADPMEGTMISSNVRLAIWRLFKENEIEIPFPQLVLHHS